MIKRFLKDKLNVEIYDSADQMSRASALKAADLLKKAIEEKGEANLIIATGASQFLFYKYLQEQQIEWKNITVFHLDEYKDLPKSHPASFRKYLKERILDIVRPKQAYFLEGDSKDIPEVISRYEILLKNHPVDLACIGIGENGHIAFNDPPVADFNDPYWVKVVQLDKACRKQQLGEGWFPTLDDVPREALSLTIPAIMASKAIICTVPDERKAEAVKNTLEGVISSSCPASILRKHQNAVLVLDKFAAKKMNNSK